MICIKHDQRIYLKRRRGEEVYAFYNSETFRNYGLGTMDKELWIRNYG